MRKDLSKSKEEVIKAIDEKYSQRFIDLDPSGYFLIKINKEKNELIVEHFSNNIDSHGQAINPETGQPFKCSDKEKRLPLNIFKGKSAKELGIKLTEIKGQLPLSKLDHALYLGRELQKAENCLINNQTYIQD